MCVKYEQTIPTIKNKTNIGKTKNLRKPKQHQNKNKKNIVKNKNKKFRGDAGKPN